MYVGVVLTSNPDQLALTPLENTLKALLWVIVMVVFVQIYIVVMSPGPFASLFLAFQLSIGCLSPA